jgi:hypothetical protein
MSLGVVRAGLTGTDLILIQVALNAVLDRTRTVSPDLYRRYLCQSRVSMVAPTPMEPSVTTSARRPPRWIRPRRTPLVVNRSR